MRALRWLDLGVLALALPVFLAAGLPVLGWAGAAAGWLAQRAVSVLIGRRAAAAEDPRKVTTLLAASMVARGWLIALSIFAAGMIEREAGLSAALLAIALVTTSLAGATARSPFEVPGPRR